MLQDHADVEDSLYDAMMIDDNEGIDVADRVKKCIGDESSLMTDDAGLKLFFLCSNSPAVRCFSIVQLIGER